MTAIKALFRTAIGVLFGFIAAFVLSPALAALTNAESGAGPAIPVLVIVGAGALLGFFAPTIRRAFGRGFLIVGICLLALPLSALLLSGRVAHETITSASADDQAFAAVGAGIAGAAFTGMATFVGLSVG